MNFLGKLGQNLKRIREAQNLTQAELAEQADVSVSTIARIELGEGFLTFKTIQKIANGLKIDIETLFLFQNFKNTNPDYNSFLHDLNTLSRRLTTKEDYNFILNVMELYINTKKH